MPLSTNIIFVVAYSLFKVNEGSASPWYGSPFEVTLRDTTEIEFVSNHLNTFTSAVSSFFDIPTNNISLQHAQEYTISNVRYFDVGFNIYSESSSAQNNHLNIASTNNLRSHLANNGVDNAFISRTQYSSTTCQTLFSPAYYGDSIVCQSICGKNRNFVYHAKSHECISVNEYIESKTSSSDPDAGWFVMYGAATCGALLLTCYGIYCTRKVYISIKESQNEQKQTQMSNIGSPSTSTAPIKAMMHTQNASPMSNPQEIESSSSHVQKENKPQLRQKKSLVDRARQSLHLQTDDNYSNISPNNSEPQTNYAASKNDVALSIRSSRSLSVASETAQKNDDCFNLANLQVDIPDISLSESENCEGNTKNKKRISQFKSEREKLLAEAQAKMMEIMMEFKRQSQLLGTEHVNDDNDNDHSSENVDEKKLKEIKESAETKVKAVRKKTIEKIHALKQTMSL